MCTWITRLHGISSDEYRYGATTAALYDGTSGIALALAVYGLETGSDRAIATATGAARHTAEYCRDLPLNGGIFNGFHSACCTLILVAKLLGLDDLLSTGVRALQAGWQEEAESLDYASGAAGKLIVADWSHRQGLIELCPNWIREQLALLIAAMNSDPELDGGLAHGNAGLAVGVIATANLLNDAALANLGYDIIVSCVRRRLNAAVLSVAELYSWCSGAIGMIDLLHAEDVKNSSAYGASEVEDLTARCLSRPEQTKQSLDSTACHGELGLTLALTRMCGEADQGLREPEMDNRLSYGDIRTGWRVGLFEGIAGPILAAYCDSLRRIPGFIFRPFWYSSTKFDVALIEEIVWPFAVLWDDGGLKVPG